MYLIVEHRSEAAVARLKQIVVLQRQEIKTLSDRIQRLETRFGEEVFINGLLVDTLKAAGIPFRDSLSAQVRKDQNPKLF